MTLLMSKRRYPSDDSSQGPERKRSAQACLPCRKKKMRCDGAKPVCAHCAKLGLDCGYNQNRKPGLQPGYVAQLQNRIGELESLLEEQSQALKEMHAALPSVANPTPERRLYPDYSHQSLPPLHLRPIRDLHGTPPFGTVAYSAPTSRRSSVAHDSNRSSPPLRQLNTNALDELAHAASASPSASTSSASPGQTSDIDPNLGMASVSFPSFPHDIFNAEPASASTVKLSTPPATKVKFELPDVGVAGNLLPPRDILDVMIDLYFEYIHPTFPILDKASFSSLYLSTTFPPDTIILLQAIVIMTSPLAGLSTKLESHAPRIKKQYAEDAAYRHKIIDYTLESPNLRSLQALTILAISDAISGHTSQLCGVLAILTRFAKLMNLHSIDAPPSPQTSMRSLEISPHTTVPSEKEECRRCFWTIFILDRFLSTATGWPLTIRDEEIQTRLPCVDEESQLSEGCRSNDSSDRPALEGMELWPLCIEATGRLGKVVSWLRTPWMDQDRDERETSGLALGNELEDWWREKVRIPNKESVSLLSAIYNCSIVLLHGPLAIDDQGRTVCPEAGRRAHDAALRIAFLHCSGIAHPVLPLSYFVAGRYLQFEGTVAKSDVQEPLTLIKRSLVASARIHPVAEQYLSTLASQGEPTSLQQPPLHGIIYE